MLDIRHISKTFNPGTVNEKRALTDLSLHLDKGEFVTVIGSNGAGKSTLFNAIAAVSYTHLDNHFDSDELQPQLPDHSATSRW